MTLTHLRCPDCGCKDVKAQRTYPIKHGEQRPIYACDACGGTFSSTSNTPMAHLKTPISVIAQVLSALTEGMGINAVTRLYGVSKKSIYRWARAPQWLQKTLLLFALTHQFLQQLIEGDELYTRGHKKVAPDASPGWTVVLMDRATRFLWDMHCGRKDRKMFKKTLGLLCQVIQQTGDLGRSACGVCTQQRMTEEIAQAFAFAARTLLEAGELSREGGKACYLLL